MLILYTILCIVFLYVSCEPCEDEWTFVARVHSCYLAPHHPLTWVGAEEYCQRAGANLVSVNSMKESHYVRLLADQHNPQFLTWIGLSREANTTEAPFRWSDGSDVTYTFFREGEPSSFGNCVALSSSEDANGWMTIDCDYSQFFLCEKRASGLEPIVLTSDAGEFYSPTYPESYPNGVSVNYYIELPPESRVLITIEQLETEQSHDFLLILDHSEESQTLAMLSGLHHNRSFLSQSNIVTAIFSSDESGNGAGFKARYSSWKVKPIELHEEHEGIVQSDGYPGFAPPFTFQQILIQCSTEQHVHLNISDFDCYPDDKLIFYDGPTSQHPVLQSSVILVLHGFRVTNHTPQVTTVEKNIGFSAFCYCRHLWPCGSSEPVRLFRSENDSVFVVFVTGDSFDLSRWRFTYDCVRKDGFGDEVLIP